MNQERTDVLRTIQYLIKDYKVEVSEIVRENPRSPLFDKSVKFHTVHRNLMLGDTYAFSMPEFIENLAYEYDIDLWENEETTVSMQGVIEKIRKKNFLVFPLFCRVHEYPRLSLVKEMKNDPDTGQMGLIIVDNSKYEGRCIDYIKEVVQSHLAEYNKYLRKEPVFTIAIFSDEKCPTCGHTTDDGFLDSSCEEDTVEKCIDNLVHTSRNPHYRDIIRKALNTGKIQIKGMTEE